MTLAGLLGDQAGENETALREAAGVLGRTTLSTTYWPTRIATTTGSPPCIPPAHSCSNRLNKCFAATAGRKVPAFLSSSLLANFAADAPETLTMLLVEADERQFSVGSGDAIPPELLARP